jgi:hypothetical protein
MKPPQVIKTYTFHEPTNAHWTPWIKTGNNRRMKAVIFQDNGNDAVGIYTRQYVKHVLIDSYFPLAVKDWKSVINILDIAFEEIWELKQQKK